MSITLNHLPFPSDILPGGEPTTTLPRLNVTIDFVLAGKAIFTVDNGRGAHYTYKVRAWVPGSGDMHKDQYPDADPVAPTTVYLAYLLTGPDRSHDWKYMGTVKMVSWPNIDNKGGRDERLVFRTSPKALPSTTGKPTDALAWALRVISYQQSLAVATIRHMELCGRCGRQLTEPESIARGIGPDCWEFMMQEGR